MRIILSTLLIVATLFVMSFTEGPGYQVGDIATDFSLKNVDGTFISMSDFEDANGFIVIFTCNTCPVAKAYEDRIIELHENFASKGYPVIAINPNDPDVKKDLRAFLTQRENQIRDAINRKDYDQAEKSVREILLFAPNNQKLKQTLQHIQTLRENR